MPALALELLGDRSTEREGFLSLKRWDLALVTNGETKSSPFRYDMVDRRALDAAVMAAHFRVGGAPHVYLRSSVRPPVALRSVEPKFEPVLWELPAGLIEPGEDPTLAAARELEEELGFTMRADQMSPLGPWSFPAPGFIGEMHWFYHVEVDPKARREPSGDGSPLEEAARIIEVPLDDALRACAAGEIRDAKTEIALFRLSRALRA